MKEKRGLTWEDTRVMTFTSRVWDISQRQGLFFFNWHHCWHRKMIQVMELLMWFCFVLCKKLQVIQETLRSASILSFTFREAVEDVEFQGYFIPKGWKVLPLFRSIHHCADFFPHPDRFDPSRFEVLLPLFLVYSFFFYGRLTLMHWI